MSLKQKINHIKRHRANRRIAKSADTVYSAAIKCFGKIDITFIVSLRLYDILYFRKDYVPKNITSSWLMPDSTVITMGPDIEMKTVHGICVPKDIMDFYNRDETEYLKEWCGIPNIKSPSSKNFINIGEV